MRGLDTLHAAFLMVPQGLGAMVTMPIAGALVDRIPVGRIVPFGLVLMTGGMFALTQVGTDTPYWGFMIPVLFVMGLGMGGTMMPLMTSALKTLQSHQVARGSTLLNITQQIASSIGVAVISVVFTNYLSASALAGPAIAALHNPALVNSVGGQVAVQKGSGRRGRRLRQHLPRRRDLARPHVDPGRLPAAQARALALPRRPARDGSGHRPLSARRRREAQGAGRMVPVTSPRPMRARPGPGRPGRHRHGVAVLEEATGRAVGERQRLGAVPRQLEQAATRSRGSGR